MKIRLYSVASITFPNIVSVYLLKPNLQQRYGGFHFLAFGTVALISRDLSSVQAETHVNMIICEVRTFCGKKARWMARDTSNNPTGMYGNSNGQKYVFMNQSRL
jgi:hypothetical protein